MLNSYEAFEGCTFTWLDLITHNHSMDADSTIYVQVLAQFNMTV